MPSPIGHTLGGLIVGLLTLSRGSGRAAGRAGGAGQACGKGRAAGSTELIVCAVAACLPDIDFLWGRHNMETHSVGFAVLVALGVYGLAQFSVTRERAALRRISSTPSQLALASGLAVVSHIVFDWLGSDDTPPLGVMALWPLTREYYFAYAYVFEAISRRYWLPNFFTHNLLAIAREVVILFPIAAALWVWCHRRGRLTGDT